MYSDVIISSKKIKESIKNKFKIIICFTDGHQDSQILNIFTEDKKTVLDIMNSLAVIKSLGWFYSSNNLDDARISQLLKDAILNEFFELDDEEVYFKIMLKGFENVRVQWNNEVGDSFDVSIQ